jgi:hypothetical protein
MPGPAFKPGTLAWEEQSLPVHSGVLGSGVYPSTHLILKESIVQCAREAGCNYLVR